MTDPVDSHYHNYSGPLVITQPKYIDPNVNRKLDILQQSLAQIGVPTILDVNGPQQIGVSKLYATHTKPPGVRSSSAQEYLVPVRNRKNLLVLKNAYATKVLIDEHKRATGVEVIVDGRMKRFFAQKEVIVSAGPINSPKILVSSGIGPREDVLNLGVNLVSDMPVGYNLQNHFYVPMFFTGGKTPDDISSIQNVPKVSLDTYPYPIMIGFTSLNGKSVPDLQMLCGYMNQSSPLLKNFLTSFNYNDQIISSLTQTNKDQEFFIMTLILLRETSRGKVTVRSIQPSVQPEIYEGYLNHPDDFRRLKDGMRKIAQLTETSYFKSVGSKIARINLPKCDQFEFLSDAYLTCYVQHMLTNQHHECSTCCMGKVVDKDLKVHGVKNLRVVDSSVIPLLICGNTYAPTAMIAEKISDVIKKDFL